MQIYKVSLSSNVGPNSKLPSIIHWLMLNTWNVKVFTKNVR